MASLLLINDDARDLSPLRTSTPTKLFHSQTRPRPLSAPLSRKLREHATLLIHRPDSPKSVISFEKYLPHESEIRFECHSPVRMYCGGSPDVVQQAIQTQFARPLSRGSGSCKFSKNTSREQEAKRCTNIGSDHIPASQHAPPLHVRFTAIDPAARVGAWRRKLREDRQEGAAKDVSASSSIQTSHPACRRCPPAEANFVDPLASFNYSKRSVSRSLTFSKSKRWKE
mmetsp:Transcript_79895/g.93376  ORF Transcript_79895/g.93376 Transcript_79895/m.93376 type:complete len:227 (+) Transcript_79895:66-746(+)